MTNKGIVFFFEGEHKAWFCKDVTFTDSNIRGYALDGCWWMDYNIAGQTINVCIGRNGGVDWDNPINTFYTKLVNQVEVPADIEGSAYELLHWARTKI